MWRENEMAAAGRWRLRRTVETFSDPQFLRCIVAEFVRSLKGSYLKNADPKQKFPGPTHPTILNKVSNLAAGAVKNQQSLGYEVDWRCLRASEGE